MLEGQVRIWHRRGQRWVGPQSVPIPGLARDDSDSEWTEMGGATFSTAGDRAAVMFTRFTNPAERQPAGVVIDLRRAQLIEVWNLSTHAVHLSEDLTGMQYQDPGIDHTDPITPTLRVVAFSPDGNKVA